MKRKQKAEEEITFEVGSDNVFADLGLPDADMLLVKADMSIAIVSKIRGPGWTQKKAAERTGLTQPEISRLGQGKLDGFSLERLQTVLCRLGIDVEIILHHHPRRESIMGTLKLRSIAS
jgi:predicted XRE-type DNA-binding protein